MQQNHRSKKTLLTAILVVCFAFLMIGCMPIIAQVTTADIVGTVTDASGAAVVSASVTSTSVATGAMQKAVVDNSGNFVFTLLQVGAYKLNVQAQGFKGYSTQVTLAAGDRARIDVPLTPGGAAETITVEATTPALQTDESTIGTLITSQATQDLPLNGRNVLNLITLSAGVTGGLGNAMNSGTRPDDRRQGSNFAANGQSDENNNNMIDGMDNNERFIGSVGVKPAIDAVEQVKVLTNLYTAEISRSGGGVVDLITKSGGNQFHGTAYEFVRNDKLDAKDYFALPTQAKPELRQNQFGGSVGGPIKKDNTFFFFDYENYRLIKGVTTTSTVPTAYEQAHPGDFSDLGTGCTNLTATPGWTPGKIGLNYFKLYPAPNKVVANPGGCAPPASNYTFTGGETQFTTTYDAKVDHRFSTKASMFARYTFNKANVYIPANYPIVNGVSPGAGPYGNFSGPALDEEHSAALGYTHLLTSNLILDLRAQYMRLNNNSTPVNAGKSVANTFGFPCNSVSCVNVAGDAASMGLPNVNFDQGYGAMGDADYVPLLDQNNTFQYTGSLSWLKGAHSVKMGAGLIRRQGSVGQSAHPRGQMQFNHNLTGNDMGDMLSDYATTVTRVETIQTPLLRAWEYALFAQDDWRVRSNLTLNLGLRWDLYTPFTAKNGAIENFDPRLGLEIGPNLPGSQKSNATVGVTNDFTDFAPRLGFAYTYRPGLVVRGGYGIGYFPGNDASGALMRNAPYTFNFGCGTTFNHTSTNPCTGPYTNPALDPLGGYYMDGGMPVPVLDMTLATNPTKYAGTTILGTAFNYRNPFLQQFSLNVQKDFKGNVATLAFVGNRGGRLVLNGTNQNQLPYPIAAGGQYPYHNVVPAGYSAGVLDGVGVQLRETVMSSNYNALQVSLQRRFNNGLAANANYTWAHNLTNAQVIDEGQAVGNCVGPCHVDNGSGVAKIYNSYFQYDYGNADIDTRHRVAITMSYDLPFGKNLTGPASVAVKGWSVNAIYYAQTGIPFTVQNPNGATSGISLGNDRPNQISSPTSGISRSINQWYNVAAFKTQAAGLLGNEMRNQVYGPGTQALGFSLFKNLPIYEALKLQLRVESFNLLNTPTFSQPGANLDSGAGKINSTASSATPRQLQGALKFIF
jgi:hypothetical protein